MSVPPTHYYPGTEVVAAAREVIRGEGDGGVIFCDELLDELAGRFGDRFRVSPDMHKLLHLIEELWDYVRIRRPDTQSVAFAWDEAFAPASGTGLKAALMNRAGNGDKGIGDGAVRTT